jgi:hypothetical protein
LRFLIGRRRDVVWRERRSFLSLIGRGGLLAALPDIAKVGVPFVFLPKCRTSVRIMKRTTEPLFAKLFANRSFCQTFVKRAAA